MSCLSVITQRIGGTTGKPVGYDGPRASIGRVGAASSAFSGMYIPSLRITPTQRATLRFGLVCPTNLDNRVGILWASDGRLITLEGGYLIPNGR